MGEQTSKTTTTTSDGNVTISVEKYHELLKDAETTGPIVHMVKTDRMVADENQMWGAFMSGLGTVVAISGLIIYRIGKRQEKKLKR